MKIRVDRLLIALGVVALSISAAVVWKMTRPDPEGAQLDEGLEHLRDKRTGKRRGVPRFVRPFHAIDHGREPSEEGPVALMEPPPHADPGDLGPEEAIDTFQAVISELQEIEASGRKLGKAERAELYNRASGSFTALSAWIDSSDESERALMEDAHQQMMSLMRELDIEPPTARHVDQVSPP